MDEGTESLATFFIANYACYTWVAIKIGDQGGEVREAKKGSRGIAKTVGRY